MVGTVAFRIANRHRGSFPTTAVIFFCGWAAEASLPVQPPEAAQPHNGLDKKGGYK